MKLVVFGSLRTPPLRQLDPPYGFRLILFLGSGRAGQVKSCTNLDPPYSPLTKNKTMYQPQGAGNPVLGLRTVQHECVGRRV